MFMSKKTAIDFHAWADEARQLRAPYEQPLTKILERDRAYQEELCARGGEITSTLSHGAERAAAKVAARRRFRMLRDRRFCVGAALGVTADACGWLSESVCQAVPLRNLKSPCVKHR